MADVVFLSSDYLNNLQDRLVRGARPGTQNASRSGLVYVDTTTASASAPVKEYLVEPVATFNSFEIPNTKFTSNSDIVTFVGTTAGTSGAYVGDFMRPATGGKTYAIEKIIGTSSLQLRSLYTGDTFTGNSQVQKKEFGLLRLSSYDNTSGPTGTVFEYSYDKGNWVTTPFATFPEGPYDTFPNETRPMEDGILLASIPNGATGTPDLRFTGFVSKYLNKPSANTPTLTFTPIPYPSDLTYPATLEYFKLNMSYKGVTRELVGGEDYLLSYTSNPEYDGYKPFSSAATSASINLLEQIDANDYKVTIKTNGLIPLRHRGQNITSIYSPTVTVSRETPVLPSGVTGVELAQDVDYVLNASSGTMVTVGYSVNEEPVEAILKALDPIYDGMEVYLNEVPFALAGSTGLVNPVRLVQGVDFNINTLNGGFSFVKPIPPDSSVEINYLVEGTKQDFKKASEFATDLRLDYFPVMPNTVTMQGTYAVNGATGTVRAMQEGVDFNLYYENGAIELLQAAKDQPYSIYANYTPAAKIKCQTAPTSTPHQYSLRVIDVPSVVSDGGKIVDTVLRAENVTLEKVRTLGGTEVSLTGVTTASPGIFTLKDSNSTLAKDGLALSTLTTVDSRVPFYPVIQYRNQFNAAATSLVLQNTMPQDSGVTGGALLLIRSLQDSSYRTYTTATSVSKQLGLNTLITLNPPLPANVLLPYINASDSSIVLSSIVGATLNSYSKNAVSLKFTNGYLLNLKAGCLINLSGAQLVSVTSVTLNSNGADLLVGINPPVRASEDNEASLALTTYTNRPVYVEGDTAILTDNGMISDAVPIFQLYRKNPPATEVRTSIVITDSTLTVTDQLLGEEAVPYSVAMNPTDTIQSFVNTITSGITGVGLILGYTGIRPLASLPVDSISDTEFSFNPIQLPYKVKGFPAVFKDGHGITGFYPLLRSDESYSVVANVIKLADPLVHGDRFKVTYTYADTMRSHIGDTIKTSMSRFVAIPKNTLFNVSNDYETSDQFYIETMTEADYLDQVITPYLEQQEQLAKGPGTLGVNDGASVDIVTPPGVTNNYYTIRENYLMTMLMWKISQYYFHRMAAFAKELQGVCGLRIGNNDFASTNKNLNRMSSWYDVTSQASFNQSLFFPTSHKDSKPLADDRFEKTYTAYDQVIPYNSYYSVTNAGPTGRVGYIKGLYSNFKEGTRDIEVGYGIQVKGTSEYIPISNIVDNTILKLAAPIYGARFLPTAPFSTAPLPSIPIMGSTYKVQRTTVPSAPIWDERGFPGAYAVGLTNESTYLGADASFSIGISEDYGSTYTQKIITFTDVPEGHYSVSFIASLLFNSALKDYATVLTENTYYKPNLYDEMSKALDVSWPLTSPDLNDEVSYAPTIVIRSLKPNIWFKLDYKIRTLDYSFEYLGFDVTLINEPGSTGLQVYSGMYDPLNCVRGATGQIPDRSTEIIALNAVRNVSNWVQRGGETGTWSALKSAERTVRNDDLYLLLGLTGAWQGAQDTMQDPDALGTPDAVVADGYYDTFTTETRNSYSADTSFYNKVNSSSYNAEINSLTSVTLTRATAEARLAATWATTHSVTLTANTHSGNDPRVVFGNKTNTNSVPLGPGYSLINVYPAYISNGNSLAPYTTTPKGSWGTGSHVQPMYSDSSTYTFVMDKAADLSASVPGVFFTTTTTGITFDKPITFTYSDYANLTALGVAIELQCPGTTVNVAVLSPVGGHYNIVPTPTSIYNSFVTIYFAADDEMIAEVSSNVSGTMLTSSSTSVTISRPVTISYTNHTTLLNLSQAITSVYPYAHITLVGAATEFYGDFQIVSTPTAVPTGLPEIPLYFGVRGDITFKSISNYALDTRLDQASVRKARMSYYLDYFYTRQAEIWKWLGADGENLPTNRKTWLTNLLNKGAGPANIVLPFKNRIIGK